MKTTTSKKNIIMKNSILFAAALLLAPCALLADVDWTAYAKSFDITFPGYKGTTTLTDFPVLVRLSAARNKFDYSKCANGYDLRFSDAEGNLLSHEIDTWNNGGESLVWVKVPLFNADTVITAHYGLTSGQPPAVTASDVWDSNYIGVWHLGDANNQTQVDSTANGLDFLCHNKDVKNVDLAASGAIGGAVGFSKGSSRRGGLYQTDTDGKLSGFSEFTIEGWIYPTNVAPQSANLNDAILANRLDTTQGPWHIYATRGSKNGLPNMTMRTEEQSASSIQAEMPVAAAPELNEWSAFAFSWESTGGSYNAYINGESKVNATTTVRTPVVKSTDAFVILGNESANTPYVTWTDSYYLQKTFAFQGRIDEVRISNVKRSSDWIKATHDCVTDKDFASVVSGPDWAGYSHKFSVTFDGYAGSETLTDFPVLVKISEGSPSGFSYADCLKQEGGDLRFADAEGKLLASEVDTWNSNGVSLIWVKVPALNASTMITAYYGLESAPAVNAASVWANDYVGVWHMSETALPLTESSGVSTPIDNGHANVFYGYSGLIGNAVDMSNVTNAYQKGGWANRLSAANDSDLDGFTDFTMEIWTRQETWGDSNNPVLLAKRSEQACSYHWYCNKLTNSSRAACMVLSTNGTSSVDKSGNPTSPTLREWTHQAFVRNTAANNFKSFVNGTNSNTWSDSYGTHPIASTSERLAFGSGNRGFPFPGQIDEVRISRVARSGDWIQATHDTVKKANFATYSKAKATTSRAAVLIFN